MQAHVLFALAYAPGPTPVQTDFQQTAQPFIYKGRVSVPIRAFS